MNSILRQTRKLSGMSYNNLYFWLNKRKDSLIYDFGIKQNLINDKGPIEYLDISILNPNIILKETSEIGTFEIDKAIYSIINPLEDSNLIKIYDIDLQKINLNPEKLENKIATFEIKPYILRETYFKYL